MGAEKSTRGGRESHTGSSGRPSVRGLLRALWSVGPAADKHAALRGSDGHGESPQHLRRGNTRCAQLGPSTVCSVCGVYSV